MQPSSAQPQRIFELDGIRGLAIILVLAFHFNVYGGEALVDAGIVRVIAKLGWCGVDLFFALSGFLITGILLDSTAPGRAVRFYKRRALRILPLYYLAVTVVFGWAAIQARPIPFHIESWFWFHLSNWYTSYSPTTYPQLSHFWSLAIEEQFYLVWPIVVWKTPRRFLLWVCIAVALLCLAVRNLPAVQALGLEYPNTLYRLTPFRIDTLVMGSIGAVLYRHRYTWGRRACSYAGLCAIAGAAGFAAVVLIARSPSPHSPAMTRFGFSALGLLFASLTTWAALHAGEKGWPVRALRTEFLRGFGQYSYCIYVIHIAIYSNLLRPGAESFGGGRLAYLGVGALSVAAIYFIAWCSWHAFEKRFISFGASASRATAAAANHPICVSAGAGLLPKSPRE